MTESTIKFDQPEKIKGQDNKTGESKYKYLEKKNKIRSRRKNIEC